MDVDIANVQLAAAKERTTQAGEKKDKTKLTIYNPIDNTILAENVDPDEVEKLLKDFKEKKGFPGAKIGKPSAAFEKPVTEPQTQKMEMDNIRMRQKLLAQASEGKTTDQQGSLIAKDLNTLLRDNDDFVYVWKPTKLTSPSTWIGDNMAAIQLPSVPAKGGGSVKMTLGDLKARAKAKGTTVDALVADMIKKGVIK